MKWRDVIIGSVTTLIVTILSGLVIYYITKDPHIEPKEKLEFIVDTSSSFDFENNKMSVASIALVNRGTKPANNVTGEIKFPSGHIKDKKISSPSGANIEIKTIDDSLCRYSFSLARFLPNDRVTISFLVDTAIVEPSVTIRSDATIATKVDYNEQATDINENSVSKILILSGIPLIIGSIAYVFLMFLVKIRRDSRLLRPRESCINNTAFVLMHQDMIEQADIMLKHAIDDGKDGCFAIANYGLSRGLLGKENDAGLLFDAALFLSNTDHERAVIHFNRSILSMKRLLWDDAKVQLLKALELSFIDIKNYCENSKLFSDLTKDRPDIMEMIKSFKSSKKKKWIKLLFS